MGEDVEVVGELTREQLMREVYELAGPGQRDELPQPNFTVQEFVRETGLTPERARDRLNRQAADGTLGKQQVGREVIYWKV